MIPRYSLPPMADLFTEEAKFSAWLEVEVLVVEALAESGIVPADHAAAVRERAGFDVAAVEVREQSTEHDVAAFVDVVQDRVGLPAGAWVHYGLTSMDVVDTGQAMRLAKACDLLSAAAADLEASLARRAREYRDTPCMGRTHGIHAEPTTFGNKLALFGLQVRRDRQRLAQARQAIAVGRLSGAVGTYSNIDPEVERRVCERLGLAPAPSTQVLARDRHAEYLYACASVGATVEAIATEVRHLARTEVREVEEGFREGAQKGSSAMPHKRNPVKAEQLCGLARVLRANVQVGLENVALWHERDISHSSAERVVLADSSLLAYYELVKGKALIDDVRVYPDRMLRNMEASHGLVFSQSVLLALVAAGLGRDDAYRLVQRSAMRTWDEERPFLEVLKEDSEVTEHLGEADLARCFDLDRVLTHSGRALDALDALPQEVG